MKYNGLKTKHMYMMLGALLLALMVPFSAIFTQNDDHTDQSNNTEAHDEVEHQDTHGEDVSEHGETEVFNPAEFAMHHIQDANEWHIVKNITLPLPIIAYSKESGMLTGMSSQFHHGHTAVDGYVMNHGRLMKVQDENFPKGKVDVHLLEKKVMVDSLSAMNSFVEANGQEFLIGRKGFIDFSITKNVASMLLVAILMWFMFRKIAKSYRKREGQAPKGLQSIFEPLILFVRDEIAKPNLGDASEKYMPFLLCVFFFIWLLNVLGGIPFFPGGANVTGNIAVTTVLALITMVLTNVAGTKYYWKHIFAPPVPLLMYPIMIPVEIAGLFIKPVALLIRLFANISAGHILILSVVGLIFIFGKMGTNLGGAGAGAAIAIPFTLFIYALELLVAFLQAFIFTILSAVFIGLARDEGH